MSYDSVRGARGQITPAPRTIPSVRPGIIADGYLQRPVYIVSTGGQITCVGRSVGNRRKSGGMSGIIAPFLYGWQASRLCTTDI